MAVKHVITRGFISDPGSIRYLPTRGYLPADIGGARRQRQIKSLAKRRRKR